MKNSLLDKIKSWRNRLKTFFGTAEGVRVKQFATYFLQIVIISIIAYQLTGIGWGKIFQSLPTEPFFYLLFLFIYFLLPFCEALAYKICWDIPYLESIPIFIKKRIFNKDVMGYSGELVLMQWAVSEKALSKKKAFKDIRDMNIISSAASTIVALGLLAVLLLSGKIRALDYLFSTDALTGYGMWDYLFGSAVAIAVIAVIYRFRKYLFSMSFSISSKVFLIHSGRMLILYAAQILQWHIVLPDIALEIWFTFLSVNIVISRIPFIPSHELVATGTNIELAKIINAPVAAVTGLFLVHDVLGKILNFVFYLYYSYRDSIAKSFTTKTDAYK